MIQINNTLICIDHFPDGTLLIKDKVSIDFHIYREALIIWHFENNEELVALIYLVNHLRSHGVQTIDLRMPYIPNARQDRVKNDEDVFTLKYFAEIINGLNFNSVEVLDPHSSVSEALINNIVVKSSNKYIDQAIYDVYKIHGGAEAEPIMAFYPDEGAMKRYSDMIGMKYAFGIKKREWRTGKILGLDVAGDIDYIKDRNIVIVDDICSRGGTFYHSAKKLKELGAKNIYLYVTHCENTILEGELLTSGLIEKVYTTNSIFTKEHEKIEVFKL